MRILVLHTHRSHGISLATIGWRSPARLNIIRPGRTAIFPSAVPGRITVVVQFASTHNSSIFISSVALQPVLTHISFLKLAYRRMIARKSSIPAPERRTPVSPLHHFMARARAESQPCRCKSDAMTRSAPEGRSAAFAAITRHSQFCICPESGTDDHWL